MYPHVSKNTPKKQMSFLGEVGTSDEPVLLMINLALQTAFLKSCSKPISLLLLGKPGIGKTRLLSPLMNLDFVSYVNDITPKYLIEFLEKIKRGEKKYLVVPDFTNCMSHHKHTCSTLIGVLRSMTEEGVTNLADYGLEFKSDKPVRAGLMTATTSESYGEFRKSWKKTGFLSRLLPFSFNHSPLTEERIMNEIDAGKADQIAEVKLPIIKRPRIITAPASLLHQLRFAEKSLSKETDSLPYRHQIQLRALTEAHAVLRGSSEVAQEDIDAMFSLLNWVNYEFKEI